MAEHTDLQVRILTRDEIGEVIADLAQLRITVFREYPYLYDGDVAYEASYLQAYQTSRNSVIVAAYCGNALVGAATGTPLSDHHDEFAEAFASTPYDLNTLFYCAESVLLPAYRGRGLGHVFFDKREAHARRLGFTHCCFCAVMRPDNHPARPADYQALDGFWQKRGYAKLAGVTTGYAWKDTCENPGRENQESVKQMQFWLREL